jgi:hypothetical protein
MFNDPDATPRRNRGPDRVDMGARDNGYLGNAAGL